MIQAPCTIYSLGGNNQWAFELDAIQRTPCHVHTFDCTGPIERFFHVPKKDRIHVHHICIVPKSSSKRDERDKRVQGRQMTLAAVQHELRHGQIDLLKMDIEGYEWPIMLEWYTVFDLRSKSVHLPMQILVEIHHRTQR